jgi:hypothetical protein
MANEEHLQILNEGVGTWNQWREDNPKEIPDLSGADLSDADLSDASLSDASLSDASLSDANLSGANLNSTNLNSASLSGANLSGANLNSTNLNSASLSGANLSGAHLGDTNLSGADLSGASLEDAFLYGANLQWTNLNNTDLTFSRFIDCYLKGAVVDNALVTHIDFQRLDGLPKPPEQLRMEGAPREVLLTGFEAREFFNLPAIVGVFLTTELIQEELGCYYFHLGEIHHRGVATGVYFVGHRHEGGGSVLRFQAKSYDEIYRVLPDLLAPFRMAEAID